MTESKHVWPLLKKNLPEVHWQRIENTAGQGVPDVNGCYLGIDVWIENKVFKGNRLIFQPQQPGWITNRIRAGGRVSVLARKDDTLFLYRGGDVARWAMTGRVYASGDIAVTPDNEPLQSFTMPIDYKALRAALFAL